MSDLPTPEVVEITRSETLAERLRGWWRETLESDSVRKWIPSYCAVWLGWALFALFILPPVPSLEEVLGHPAYLAWVVMAIPANFGVIAGLWMRQGGAAVADMTTPLLFRDWMGLISQATGHIVCHLLMIEFQITAWIAVYTYDGPNTYAGLTIFAATLLLPWTFGTLLLFLQCLLKIQRGKALEAQNTLEHRLVRERLLERQRRREAGIE